MKLAPVALVLALALVAGCRTNVSLGSPNEPEPEASAPDAACPASDARSVVATLDPELGELRALAAGNGVVVAAFARRDGAGAVAVAPASGGAFTELARIGADPIAVAFDGTYAYVACQASAQVYRVRAGDVAVAPLQGAVSSVTVGAKGRAFWTRPADDAVVTWTIEGGAPWTVATIPRAQSILERDRTLYVAGAHALFALAPTDAAPTKLADVCGQGALAASGDAVFCIDAGTLFRVDVNTHAVLRLATGIAERSDLVVARGQAFYRSGATLDAMPLDGIGGPSVVDVVGPGPSPLASDGCGLYYSVGSSLRRRAL